MASIDIKLTGSEAQIAWAADIIAKSMETIESNIALNQSRKSETGWSGYDMNIAAWEAVETEYKAIVESLDGQHASYVIDHKHALDANATTTRFDRAYTKLSNH
ncbi:MAG: hypothetical protein VB062_04520 [Christensenella sp.]|nr:hypothetical protein [Christensenella sp.]